MHDIFSGLGPVSGNGTAAAASPSPPAAGRCPAVLFGLGNGALTLARAELLHAHYPATIFGSVNGKVSWWVNLAQALTPFGMGWLFTQFGSYLPSLLLLSVLATLAALHKDLYGFRLNPADFWIQSD
ncbi:hypothetical protein ACINK0_13295 [Deinococcus sp. VB343]|uniref:hypothetical protein n=1 Tax=Deinococcus sp. VB343 TaxID=3385567 RepID=UPI0039C9C1F5